MFTERTSVGLDVHARSVVAAAIDGVTGELFQSRLTPSCQHMRSRIADLPGPVAVAYEAGPTGFGLHRALTEAGIRCAVAARRSCTGPRVVGVVASEYAALSSHICIRHGPSSPASTRLAGRWVSIRSASQPVASGQACE